jgi:Enoyl-CoA hydratase/isomerase
VTDEVEVRIQNQIAEVTLNRPPVNALARSTYKTITKVFNSFVDQHDVRAVILTGQGTKAFCAGRDINDLQQERNEPPSPDLGDPSRSTRKAFWAVRHCAVPVICAVNGPAIGAGVALVAVSDIAIRGRDFCTNGNRRWRIRRVVVCAADGWARQSTTHVLHRRAHPRAGNLSARWRGIGCSSEQTDGRSAFPGFSDLQQEPGRDPIGQGICGAYGLVTARVRISDRAGLYASPKRVSGFDRGDPGVRRRKNNVIRSTGKAKR